MRNFSRREAMMFAAAAGAVPLATSAAFGKRTFFDPGTAGTQFPSVLACTVNVGATVRTGLWVVPQIVMTDGTNGIAPFFTAPMRLAAGTQYQNLVPIAYMLDGPLSGANPKLHFSLPWAPHSFLACPAKSGNMQLTQHTFDIRAGGPVKSGGAQPIHVEVQAGYGGTAASPALVKPPTCCFMCGDLDICIPLGHNFLCNGVEMTCSS
jgi:hypothetical protein